MRRNLVRESVVVAVVSALSGCIALPVPAHYVSARRNIGEAAPAFIEAGTTTRADVLMTLGKPEFVKSDKSEFVYLAARNRAGVWITYGWREYTIAKTEFRELDVIFDERGIVAMTTVSTGLCVVEAKTGTCGRVALTKDGEPRIADWPEHVP